MMTLSSVMWSLKKTYKQMKENKSKGDLMIYKMYGIMTVMQCAVSLQFTPAEP